MIKSSLENIKSAYFIGIGGVSMSSLALILKSKGIAVKGYDMNHSDNTRMLEENGIEVFYSHKKSNFNGVDTVIYSAAIKSDNPEYEYAIQNNLTLISRAGLLKMITSSYKYAVGISGTHGKSTTTGMLSEIFLEYDKSSSILAGAVIPSINSTFKIGTGDRIVFEACEYKDSFLDMIPSLKVVLNCRHDHVDYFKTIDNVIDSFGKFINTPRDNDLCDDNIALVNLDCENAYKASLNSSAKIYYFSTEKTCDFYASKIDMSSGYGKFYLNIKETGESIQISLKVPGLHNISNAVAAAGAAYLTGVPADFIKSGLEKFHGVARRFEFKGRYNNMCDIVDDYAHHPDEISATLKSAKKLNYKRVICVFQPHTYSRTSRLLPEFAKALSIADKVLLCEIYAAREVNQSGISSRDLCKLINGAEYYSSFEEIANRAKEILQEGDLLITMGAGEAYKAGDMLLNC